MGAVLGAVSLVAALWVSVGGPVPMTEAAVNAKVTPIMGVLTSLQRTQLDIRGDLTNVQRAQLRAERLALENAMNTASTPNKIAFNMRLGQIQDEMSRLDRRSEQNEKQLDLH